VDFRLTDQQLEYQARCRRFAAEVMRPIAGVPMVRHVVERSLRMPGVDRVVVATSDRPSDDVLAAYLKAEGVPIFRGSEADVLDRYVQAARVYRASAIVRVTADCPLLSPAVSGIVVARLAAGGCDYASNTLERTYPRGLDTSACTLEALGRAAREATQPAEREHVMTYIRRHPDRFRLCSVTDAVDRSDLRWTVDTEADLEFVTRLFEALLPDNPVFEYTDVLAVLDRHPEWADINRGVAQKADPA
jgi:spore coat polysaccharide biosynthesis protein SpsF